MLQRSIIPFRRSPPAFHRDAQNIIFRSQVKRVMSNQVVCRERAVAQPRPLPCSKVAVVALWDFPRDDGWPIASHIALSTLMSLFPFLIFITALTGFLFGTEELADQVAALLLEAWPKEVAGPIASQVARVLTTAHSGP